MAWRAIAFIDGAYARDRTARQGDAMTPRDAACSTGIGSEAVRLTGGAFDPWAMPGGVDPTGIVKGWATARALDELQGAGVAAAMVNAGGDIACFGEEPWRIGVRDPHDADRLVCVAEVRSAIATSGGSERPDEIIDPATAAPAAGLSQATVVGDSLAICDAFATALIVSGERGLRMLEPGYTAVIVDADGRMLATPGFPLAPAVVASQEPISLGHAASRGVIASPCRAVRSRP